MQQKSPQEAPTTERIKDLFATSYRIPTYELTYKAPGRLRVEGKAGPLSALLIYVGNTKTYKIGMLKKTEDVQNNPGQKQSLMDVGIFSKDWLTTDYQAIFQRREGALLVYKLVQRNTNNKSHELVWLNPKTFITEKRLSYNSESELQKEIRYVKARELKPGIFLPSRVEIYNQFGKLGAVQTVESARINAGVPESLFSL